MRKFTSAARCLVMAVTLVTIALSGCGCRSENQEQPPVSTPDASSQSSAARDQNSSLLEAFGGEYDSQELLSRIEDHPPKSDFLRDRLRVKERAGARYLATCAENS
jgi:hypothetical protein